MLPAWQCEGHDLDASCADGVKNGLQKMTVLEFDLSSFNRHIPRMARPQSIGHGVKFLNRCGTAPTLQLASRCRVRPALGLIMA